MEWPDELVVLYERTYRSHVQLVYAMIGSRHEAEEIVQDGVLHLSERQRAAVVLRYVAGLADNDIASALGCRRATVRSLVARGLASLRSEVPR